MKLGRKIAEGFAVDEEPVAEPAVAADGAAELVSDAAEVVVEEPAGQPTRV